MNPEFDECLKRNKIKTFPLGTSLVEKELRTAQQDLKIAEESFRNKHYKWCTIQSYYVMFHSARALLYAKNYRERSHYCLIVAIRTLYVETRLLQGTLLEALGKGKRLREDADYYDRWSEEGAEVALKSAREFARIAQELTKDLKKKEPE